MQSNFVETRDPRCHHCGIVLLGPLGLARPGRKDGETSNLRRIWCLSCTSAPGGECKYCKRSVLDKVGCWTVQTTLDHAAMRLEWGSDCCPMCAQHGKVTRLEILRWAKNSVTLGCYYCGTTQERIWHPGVWPK